MTRLDSDQRTVYSVSQLNSEVRAVLEGSFPLLWVEGEMSNLATPRSGHLYFSLKDPAAQVRCALFRNKRQLLRYQPVNGDQVMVRARISFYEPRGDFQLIVEHIEAAGAGAAQRAFEALKQKLQAEGLFDAARKKPLPAFPLRIGVITSPSGAAIRDVVNVLRRRAPHLTITLYPALVQGTGAADDVYAALELALQRAECDLLLITRGGGSAEDLAAFNDERLARLIAASPLPIVSAIGHEIDFTIADFVADRRAPTPSAAAELISPDSAALYDALNKLQRRLSSAARRRLARWQQQSGQLDARLARVAPAARLQQQQQRLDNLDLRLNREQRRRLAQCQQRLSSVVARFDNNKPQRRLAVLSQRFGHLPERLQLAYRNAAQRSATRLHGAARQLHAVSPLATMQRGYSVLRDPQTLAVISSVTQVHVGTRLQGLLADGELKVTVDDTRLGTRWEPDSTDD